MFLVQDNDFTDKIDKFQAEHPAEYEAAVAALTALDAQAAAAPAVVTEEALVAPTVAAPLVAPAHEYNSDYLHITPTQLMLSICGVLAFGIYIGNSLQDHCHPHDFHDL